MKPQPPYSYAVKQALAKNPDRLVVVRYGNDGWTHAAVENDDFFSERPNPQTIVMPESDHWKGYWWPLCDARVWVDWPFVTQSKTHAFVSYLLNVIKAREVSFYDQKAKDMIMVRRKEAVA